MGWNNRFEWRPYVPVALRKHKAMKAASALAKKQGRELSPVEVKGRKIAETFWGKAWCTNLESYSDFSNRLPRGATYVRNGSVVDLQILPGKIDALVAGSETYQITITIEKLSKATWKALQRDCSASIDSLLDLLSGRFSDGIMARLTQQAGGLFPSPREIKMKCSCPDYSYCCKHLAAVMYGVGSRLDKQPELLFLLRDVDHQKLASAAVSQDNLERELSSGSKNALAGEDLGALFGIDLDTQTKAEPKSGKHAIKKAQSTRKRVATQSPKKTKKVPTKKTAKAFAATANRSRKSTTISAANGEVKRRSKSK